MIRVCKISANLYKNIFKRKINLYIYFKSGSSFESSEQQVPPPLCGIEMRYSIIFI